MVGSTLDHFDFILFLKEDHFDERSEWYSTVHVMFV